ncbi:hypothetical protein Tco_0635154 [Tanacetum coccineum]
MRNRLCMHSIKNDSVLGRLKFVAKNEDNQVYGMSILDVMLNNEIQNSKAYQTYLGFLTGAVNPKKARKGTKAVVTLKKKCSFTANDNIIPDPDVALELGKSISKTEAKEHEEARKVHETHERLITAKTISDEESNESDAEPARRPTGRRRQTGVVFRDTYNVSKKKTPAQSQKLKSMEMLPDATLLEAKTRKAIKASRRDYRFQQETDGLSEGAGNTPEVPDEPKDKSTNTNKGADEDDVFLFSDDQRTESEKETSESGKTDEDSDDEEEHVEDEYVHDADNVHDDVEKKYDVNVEMKDAKIIEETVKDVQVKDDDQAITNVPIAHKEKPDVPPSSSSLSISSDYGTQFLNLPFDFTLIGITKESADTEINSMLDIQIQQKITTVQSPTLLVVLVDHSEVIAEVVQTNVINEVNNQLPKLPSKAVSDFVTPSIEGKIYYMLQEYIINPEQHDTLKDVSKIRKIKLEH